MHSGDTPRRDADCLFIRSKQPGQLDLYVKQVSGSTPLRLTFDGLGNTTPEFSPDGSEIVFHSSVNGGGIYAVPTFGGQPRLLAKEGQNPKISPDGSKVAYWVGGENVASAVPGSGTVWVVPIGGGQAWQIATNLTSARYPVWSPDGQGLLVVGYASSRAYENNSLDWWFVSLNGKRTIKSDIEIPLTRAGLQDRDALGAHRGGAIPNPSCWSATGAVSFSAQSGSARNLWQTFVSPETGKAKGDLNRLTVGAANEWEPACGQEDRIVFTSLQVRRNVWSVPFNLNAGKSKGRLEQVTHDLEREEHAALSRDARYVAFASPQAGIENIWLREIATGKELRLAESANLQQRFPVISPSGSKVAFSVYWSDGARSVNIAGLGGPEEQACKGECLRATDWSSDEKSLLIFGGNPYRVSALDIGSRAQTVLFKHDRSSLLYARYSPDNRWVSFTSRSLSNYSTIMAASISGARPVPESHWIQIADAGPEDWANWSPDGRTLYFTSARDGHSCLWGQRLDPASRQPAGDAFAAFHLHGSAKYQQGGWSAAGDRIVMVLTTDSGNVWLLSRSRSR